MDAQTAYNIINQLDLSQKDVLELISLLKGAKPKRKGRKSVISVAWAKKDFKNRLNNRLSIQQLT